MSVVCVCACDSRWQIRAPREQGTVLVRWFIQMTPFKTDVHLDGGASTREPF